MSATALELREDLIQNPELPQEVEDAQNIIRSLEEEHNTLHARLQMVQRRLKKAKIELQLLVVPPSWKNTFRLADDKAAKEYGYHYYAHAGRVLLVESGEDTGIDCSTLG